MVALLRPDLQINELKKTFKYLSKCAINLVMLNLNYKRDFYLNQRKIPNKSQVDLLLCFVIFFV